MVVYCTNPECGQPQRNLNQSLCNENNLEQQNCGNCGMPLILDRRYLPLKEIGSGGFGKTFLAIDLHFQNHHFQNHNYAVKILHPRQRLNREQVRANASKF